MEEKDKNSRVEIEIVRHKGLFEILKDPRQLWKAMLAMFLLTVVLFLGLSVVVVSVKSMYPYETVKTNPYGATILEDEDKEVIYWLFNTAELWANSGIEVKADDVLTIRSSGRMHTAVHHLVKDAKENKVLDDQWLGTDGEQYIREEKSSKDKLRTEFRIAQNNPESVLLMQVIAYEDSNLSDRFISDSSPKTKDRSQRILSSAINEPIVIGKERTNLRPGKDGILHFAANDIVLTDSIISEMYLQYMNDILSKDAHGYFSKDARKEWTDLYETCIRYPDAKEDIYERYMSLGKDSALKKALEALEQSPDRKQVLTSVGLAFGRSPEQSGSDASFPVINELTYYKKHNFRDAWFADNIGSFLIVIERKKHK